MQKSIDQNPITPAKGFGGDLITIHGKGFYDGLNVKFGDDSICCEFIDENTLQFLSPDLSSGIYSISLYGDLEDFEIAENISFTILELKITGVNPAVIRRGDILTISLENRNSKEKYDDVYIDDNHAKFIDANSTYIRVRINSDSTLKNSPIISVKNGSRKANYQSNLQTEEYWEQVFKDDNFNLNETRITYPYKIPVMISKQYPEHSYVMHQFNETSNNWDEITSDNRIGKYPEILHKGDLSYIVSTYKDNQERNFIKILSYSILTKEWKEEGSIYYNEIFYHLIAFLKDDKIYIGDQNFLKTFDLNSKTWEDKSVFPGEKNPLYPEYKSSPTDIISFVLKNRCFVLASYYHSQGHFSSELLEYNPDDDSWNFIMECPFFYDSFFGSTCCKNEQITYVTTYSGAWILNTTNNTWEAYYRPLGFGCRNFTFILNDYIYYGYGEQFEQYRGWYNDFWVPGITLSRINIDDLFILEK